MKICPNCGNLISYNSYFGAYICYECKWEDADYGIMRNKGNDVFCKIVEEIGGVEECIRIKRLVEEVVFLQEDFNKTHKNFFGGKQ